MRLHLRLVIVLGMLGSAFGETARAQEKAPTPLLLEGRAALPAGLAPAGSRRNPIVLAVERAKGAVVNIHSERNAKGSAGDLFSLAPLQNRVNGMGTGILIDPRGYIITNHHVVEDVSLIRIRLADGTQQTAVIVARSPESDLALLKIDAGKPLPIIPLGTAADLMVGETVIAIGNAYGYENTVSVGVVSAIKRDVSLNKETSYKSLIQTDASINPGNSGGPLLNLHGELVGVNVAIRAGAQGIGFAIPVDTMIRVAGDLLRSRRRSSCGDGLVCRDHLEQTGDHLTRTVVVDRVDSDSPASQAGVRAGDALLQVGDVPIVCTYDVERALLERKAGDQVAMVVRRDGQDRRVDVTLGPPERVRNSTTELVWHKLGLQLAPVDAELVTRANRQLHGGMEVVAVSANSPAFRAGIKKGDILVGLQQWETVSLDNIAYVLGQVDLAVTSRFDFYVIRDGLLRTGKLGPLP